jgi:hypothetical protein
MLPSLARRYDTELISSSRIPGLTSQMWLLLAWLSELNGSERTCHMFPHHLSSCHMYQQPSPHVRTRYMRNMSIV